MTVNRNHYKQHPSGIEPLDIAKWESFNRGNIIKYVMRAPYKGDELGDLTKARDYIDAEIEMIRTRHAEQNGGIRPQEGRDSWD